MMLTAIQAATQVVLHFVGIIVMTTQTNVTSTTSSVARIASDTNQGPALVAIIPPVDFAPHTALIAFANTIPVQPADNSVDPNAVTWPVQNLRTGISYALIGLHDQLTFQTGLPTSQNLDTRQFLLPRLREAWATDKTGSVTLAPGYTGPNYPSAVAVVKVTEGTISGCSPEGRPGRADTIVTLNTGVLTIKAGNKQLRLAVHDKDEVTIANVPLNFAQDPAGGNSNHYAAYCAMAAPTIAAARCTAPTVTQLPTCQSNNMIFPPPPHHDPTKDIANARVSLPPQSNNERKAIVATPAASKSTTPLIVGTDGQTSRASGKQPIKPGMKMGSVGGTAITDASGTPTGAAGSADCSNTQWP